MQASNWVWGLEGDVQSFHLNGRAVSGPVIYASLPALNFTINTSASTDWLATVRGRVGFLATPALLLYGTGGLAVANVKSSMVFTDTWPAAASAGSRRRSLAGRREPAANMP